MGVRTTCFFKTKVCRVLGLPPDRVDTITLDLSHDSIGYAHVQIVLDKAQMADIGRCLIEPLEDVV